MNRQTDENHPRSIAETEIEAVEVECTRLVDSALAENQVWCRWEGTAHSSGAAAEQAGAGSGDAAAVAAGLVLTDAMLLVPLLGEPALPVQQPPLPL